VNGEDAVMVTFRLLSRRWQLALATVAALLFGFAMLHPYLRQSLFGPTIRGEPWCVWEDEVRRNAKPEEHQRAWWTKFRLWLGVKEQERMWASREFDPELLQLLLQLSRDPDEAVRAHVIFCLDRNPEWFRDPSADAILFERLEENDIFLRTTVAESHWFLFKDTRVFRIILQDIQDPRCATRHGALMNCLKEMCQRDEEYIPKVAVLLDHKYFLLRIDFLYMATHFGKNAVPYLIRGLQDEYEDVRRVAIDRLAILGTDGQDAAPALEAMLTETDDVRIQREIERALQAIDPVRYPKLTNEKD
jgi:HEAT repeats